MKHFSQEEKEKQQTESHKSRVEREFFLHNLENREEKENFCLKILKIEKRNENTILQLEIEKYSSFLLEIFSRSRLLSMTASPPRCVRWIVPSVCPPWQLLNQLWRGDNELKIMQLLVLFTFPCPEISDPTKSHFYHDEWCFIILLIINKPAGGNLIR